jgi:hypothetical protein
MTYMKNKKTSSGKIPEEVEIYSHLIYPQCGAGFSTFPPKHEAVAKASQGLIPPPFLIKLYVSL